MEIVLYFVDLSDDNIQLVNKISKSDITNDNSLIVINITENGGEFNLVYNGGWYCKITELPSISKELIFELNEIVKFMQSSYGTIYGNYDGILKEYNNLLENVVFGQFSDFYSIEFD